MRCKKVKGGRKRSVREEGERKRSAPKIVASRQSNFDRFSIDTLFSFFFFFANIFFEATRCSLTGEMENDK